MIRILMSAAFGALLGAAAVAVVLLYAPWTELWQWEPAGPQESASSSPADGEGSDASQASASRGGDVSETNAPSEVREAKEAEPPRIDRLLPAEAVIEIDRFAEAPRIPEPDGVESRPADGANPHPPDDEQPEEGPAASPQQRPVDYRELGDRIFEVAEALDRFKDKLRQSTEWEKAEEGEPPPAELPEAAEAAGDEELSRGDPETPSRPGP